MNTNNIWTTHGKSQNIILEKTNTPSSHKIGWASANIEELKAQEKLQKSKEQIQAEIMSYFIQHPDENILLSINISRNPENWCEVVDFWNAEFENETLSKLFDTSVIKKLWGIKIEANETWEKWEEFVKELVINRKTNTKWILLVWKKWYKIEKIDFEDVSKYYTPYETYFAYKKEGKLYIKAIKNEHIDAEFITKDSNVFGKINWIDWLAKMMTLEKIQDLEGIIKTLQEAKQNWYLDEVINFVINDIQVPEETKQLLRDELYRIAQD